MFGWAFDGIMAATGTGVDGKTVDGWREGTSHDVTFSNNRAAEGLADASHPKGENSKGSLVHDNTTGIVFYRNIWSHNVERAPLVKAGAQVLMINNLFYKPGHRALHCNLMILVWVGHDYVKGQITALGHVMRVGTDTEIERAHVRTPATHATLVCRLLLKK